MKQIIGKKIILKNLLILIIILLSITSNSIIGVKTYSNNLLTLSSSIIVGPYSQNPQKNSITILWQTDIITTINEVHWGRTPECGNISKEMINVDLNLDNLHRVIINDLDPSTKYFYKVKSDDIESNIFTFHTSFEKDDEITFIVYGDSRGVWDNWQNASIVAKEIENHNPNLVLHSGDLVKDGNYIDQWLDFFSVSDYIHNSTLIPILGNHEYYGSPFFNYFELPNNERWFSFDYGPVHFVGLDSNYVSPLRLIQLIWLIKDLKSNNQPFTCVYFHYPVYSSGSHGSTFYLRLLWKPIFDYFNVDIVFNGHDHNYERGIVRDINYIVTGGGGAPLRSVGSSWWTIHSEKAYHYCLISSNSSFLSFQAIKADGTVIDTFSIQK
jgi:hypothetical protein